MTTGTAGSGQSGPDSSYGTARTGQPGQDGQDRTARTGQPGQDSRDWIAIKVGNGQPGLPVQITQKDQSRCEQKISREKLSLAR
jgi:hypothetical protein